jgi:hypothetical protein
VLVVAVQEEIVILPMLLLLLIMMTMMLPVCGGCFCWWILLAVSALTDAALCIRPRPRTAFGEERKTTFQSSKEEFFVRMERS